VKKILNQLKRRKRTGKDTIDQNSLSIIASEFGYETTVDLIFELEQNNAIQLLSLNKKLYQIKVS
jgi:hypothetical protein